MLTGTPIGESPVWGTVATPAPRLEDSGESELMMDEDRDGQRGHPWWQRRASTARVTTLYAVLLSLMAGAWVVVMALLLEDDPAGWLVSLAIAVVGGWVLLAAAHVAGAVAQRRQKRGVSGR